MSDIKFQPPPDWLIQAYMSRPQPAEIVNQGLSGAIQAYADEKQAQAKEQSDALGHISKLADNVDLSDPNTSKALAPLFKKAGISPDIFNPNPSTPPTPSTGTMASPTPQSPVTAGMNDVQTATPPMSQAIQASLAAGHPDILGLDPNKMIRTSGGRKKMASAEGALKYQAAVDAVNAKKNPPPTPYFDARGNKQFELPAGGKLIPGSVTANGKTFIGNDSEGNPLFADKTGTITPGSVPTGGPVLPKNSTQATAATRSSAEFADTILPHIQSMRDLISQADKAGYIGPAAGRVYGKFLAGQVGSTGNPQADQLLGQLRATDSLIKTGAMKVHFGARGGSQMYDHFSNLLNSGQQSAAMLNGSLDALESFMQGYSRAGKPKGSQGNGPQIGDVENGYRFKGGNPADQTSWEKQ